MHSGYDGAVVVPMWCASRKAKLVQTLSTYTQALKAIWARSGYDRGYISNPFAGDNAAKLGLQRTQILLEQSGYVDLPYEIVHVAGSKGKGSTCTMIDSMLRASGIRTGRYLSPHLHSFRERFVVNDELISESDFVALTDQFVTLADAIESSNPELGGITAFELTTAMALAWFAQQNCQVAVIEVGMGGSLDSTNIVDPTVCVIATLDFEHTAILGTSMAEIAGNKAGIIKPNRPVVAAHQPAEAMKVIESRAAESDSPLAVACRDWSVAGNHAGFTFTQDDLTIAGLHSALVGPHQVENAGLAIAAVLALRDAAEHLAVDEGSIRRGIASARLPGRFEQISLPTGQTIVIDGAHTPASAAALAQSVREQFPNSSVTIAIGMLVDKSLDAVVKPLEAIATKWIATAPANPRAISAVELSAAMNALGYECEIATDVSQAIDLAKDGGSEIIVVTGSFTTAAEARVALGLPTVIDPPM